MNEIVSEEISSIYSGLNTGADSISFARLEMVAAFSANSFCLVSGIALINPLRKQLLSTMKTFRLVPFSKPWYDKFYA